MNEPLENEASVAAILAAASVTRSQVHLPGREQWSDDAVDYWMGTLSPALLRQLTSAMLSDVSISRYVLEVGVALRQAGVLEVDIAEATPARTRMLVFPPTAAPYVYQPPAMAADTRTSTATDASALGLPMATGGFALSVRVRGETVVATLAFGENEKVAVAGAGVSLVKLREPEGTPIALWTGVTDEAGLALLSGGGAVKSPSARERYEFRVALPEGSSPLEEP
jgi:hypothetical protein